MFGIETNNLNDSPTSRGTQLLAALDYLTQQSSVRNRVDAGRLAVTGHSMGGGALDAALRRPSLKATIGNAPYLPSGNLSNDRAPTLIYAMQNDTLVTPARLTTMYNTIPATTERAYIEVAGAGHRHPLQPVPVPNDQHERHLPVPQQLPTDHDADIHGCRGRVTLQST